MKWHSVCCLIITFSVETHFIFFLHASDEFLKLVMRDSCPNHPAPGNDIGWRSFIPRYLYEHVGAEFLEVMENLLSTIHGFNVGEISGTSGHSPFSIKEFNDTFHQEYVSFATSGDPSLDAIVYHTTPSYRNRNPGWYHIVRYGGNDLLDVADPVFDLAVVRLDNRSRSQPCVFWSKVCETTVNFPNPVVDATPLILSYHLSVGKILVGAMVLKHHPELVGQGGVGTPRVKTLSKRKKVALFETSITPSHVLGDLFRSYATFSDYVDNTIKVTLKLPSYPFEDHADRHCLLHRFNLCSRFVVVGRERDVLDDQVERIIASALNAKLLKGILSAAAGNGMNTRLVHFFLNLYRHYDEAMGENVTRARGNAIATAWREHEFQLPDSVFL